MSLQQEQHTATAQEGRSPVLIPLHNDFSSTRTSTNSGPPEWAMIELNGELLAPQQEQQADKENPTSADSSLLRKDQVELGSVRFVDNVSDNDAFRHHAAAVDGRESSSSQRPMIPQNYSFSCHRNQS